MTEGPLGPFRIYIGFTRRELFLFFLTMEFITYGYDLDAEVHERGIARADQPFLRAVEDSRGFGWQVIFDVYGNRSRHMSKEQALEVLCKEK